MIVYQFIFRQWKNRKVTIALIIVGFFIGGLVMSLGTSASIESIEYINDQKGGNPDQQLDIFLTQNGEWHQKDVEETVERLSEFGEVQLLSMKNRKLDLYNDEFPVVPVLFHQDPEWHIPLVDGRYFSKEDMDGNKTIIIGKSIGEKYGINLGDKVVIENKEFHVIGLGGRSTRETSWEHAMYMSWKDYIDTYRNCFIEGDNLHGISIRLKDGKDQFIKKSKSLIEISNSKGIKIVYKNLNNVDNSSFRNTLIITVVSTLLIYTIAIINIVHLMLYWLIERRREFGIMKALGANSGFIAKTVLFEVLIMSVIGGLLAILVQYLAMILLSDSPIGKEITFQVTWFNLFSALGVSLFFGIISAIAPALKAMRLEPISAINRT